MCSSWSISEHLKMQHHGLMCLFNTSTKCRITALCCGQCGMGMKWCTATTWHVSPATITAYHLITHFTDKYLVIDGFASPVHQYPGRSPSAKSSYTRRASMRLRQALHHWCHWAAARRENVIPWNRPAFPWRSSLCLPASRARTCPAHTTIKGHKSRASC